MAVSESIEETPEEKKTGGEGGDPNNEKLDPRLISVLKDLVSKFEREDSWVRKQQVKIWKKNEEFWHGIQYVFWSESKQDWVAPQEFQFQPEEGREDAEGPFYDFVVNIYKAHGESIIAALSAQIPSVRFPPDNADDEDDITTSKTFDKISDLIQRHNQSKIMLLRALLMIWNQGTVYAYHAPKADRAFGMTMIPNFKRAMTCQNCQQSKPVESDDMIEGLPCPTCGGPLVMTQALDGMTQAPKSRVLIDILGPLHVKVPYYARTQKDWGYLIYALDQPSAFLKNLYPHIADKLDEDDGGMFEKTARSPSSFSNWSRADENHDLKALKRVWFRPWQFDGIAKELSWEKEQLQKMFPNGCYVTFVGTNYAESRDEDMDKYWTGGQAGLSTYWHSDSLGQPLVPIQELRNVLVNMTADTIEHGIPTMFANPKVLNFKDFSRHEARPGQVYPAKPIKGEKLEDAFFNGDRASLSPEVAAFGAQLDKDGQFVVGSFPSIYGGPSEGKSRTAQEYNMSRQMALQRLSICWAFLVYWWSKMMEKCVHLYAENIVADEQHTVKEDTGYASIWIRRAELTGSVGEVEPEGAESFPISTAQKQDLLMRLIAMNNAILEQAIFSVDNRKIVADAMAFPEFKIPGEDQRIKQAREIQMILKGQPVQVNPLVDDNDIHSETIKSWAVSDIGMECQRVNPKGYAAVMQHMQQHGAVVQNNEQQAMEKSLKADLLKANLKGNLKTMEKTVGGDPIRGGKHT